MNQKVDKYLKSEEKWQKELKLLRRIALDCELDEEFKWGRPLLYVSKQEHSFDTCV